MSQKLRAKTGVTALAIVLSIIASLSAHAQDSDEVKNPIIGTWALTADCAERIHEHTRKFA